MVAKVSFGLRMVIRRERMDWGFMQEQKNGSAL